MTITWLDHADAARAIAADLTGRRHHIVIGTASPQVGAALADVPIWTAYLQNTPNGTVMTIHGGSEVAPLVAFAASVSITPAAIVVTVPKGDVTAGDLRAAFGTDDIPEDGSRDLISLDQDGDGLVRWPTLFVDAVAIDDPVSARDIRLSDIAAQN